MIKIKKRTLDWATVIRLGSSDLESVGLKVINIYIYIYILHQQKYLVIRLCKNTMGELVFLIEKYVLTPIEVFNTDRGHSRLRKRTLIKEKCYTVKQVLSLV